jgi:hypothetical protein
MKPFQLSIPKPCHENWDRMTPNDQGRFCAACQKTVVDFTSMNDRELIEFFKQPQGSVCGRLNTTQLERNFIIPKKPLPLLRYLFAIALPAFLFQNKAVAQKGRVRKVEMVHCGTQRIQMSEIEGLPQSQGLNSLLEGRAGEVIVQQKDETVIGRVRDENNNAVAYATVVLKGTKTGVPTDSAGHFKLTGRSLMGKTLVISAIGFNSLEQKISGLEVNIVLTTRELLGEVVVVGYITKKPAKSQPLLKRMLDTAFARFSLYPNPAPKGHAITLNTQKMDKGVYVVSCISAGGEVIFNEERIIDRKNQLMQLSLPAISTGTYYISLFNRKTAKSYTEKLIIK